MLKYSPASILDVNPAREIFSVLIRLNDFNEKVREDIAQGALSEEDGYEIIMMNTRHIYILVV
jgi:hypothetical protein